MRHKTIDISTAIGVLERARKIGRVNGHERPKVVAVDDGKAYRPPPVHIFPNPVRDYISHAAKEVGVDEAYVMLPLLAVLASAIGNSRVAVVKRGFVAPSIAWTLLSAPSGSTKSPAMDLATRFAHREQAKIFRDHRAAMADYAERVKAWKQEKDGDFAGDEPVKPEPAVSVVTSNATVEALITLLDQSPRGLLLAVDEAAGWLKSFNQYRGGQGGDREQWLTFNGGGTVKVDRKTGNRPQINIPKASVSVCGTIQPGILADLLKQDEFASGFAARLLIANPPVRPPVFNDHEIPGDLIARMEAIFDGLYGLQHDIDVYGRPEPKQVKLTDEALEEWIPYQNAYAPLRVNEDDEDHFCAAYSKLMGYALRFALIIHTIKVVAGEMDPTDEFRLDADSLRAGIELEKWFRRETVRVYGTLGAGGYAGNLDKLVDFIRRRGGVVTLRDVMRYGPKVFRSRNEASEAAVSLEEGGFVALETRQGDHRNGRPFSMIIRLKDGI